MKRQTVHPVGQFRVDHVLFFPAEKLDRGGTAVEDFTSDRED